MIMKAVEKFEGYSVADQEYSITRMNWTDAMLSVSLIQGGRFFFGAGGASVLIATVIFGIYIVPLMLLSGLLMYAISNLILRVVYHFITPTRQVRWNANSCLYFFWTFPIWVLVPGILVFATMLVGLIPFGIYNAVYNASTFSMTSPESNLFFMVYGAALDASTDWPTLLKMVFFWDPNSTTISTIKFILMPVVGYLGWFGAHPEFSEEQFLNSKENIWLFYEQR